MGGGVPRDFGLEGEGEVLFLQGYADFAGVGGWGGGDEGPGHCEEEMVGGWKARVLVAEVLMMCGQSGRRIREVT